MSVAEAKELAPFQLTQLLTDIEEHSLRHKTEGKFFLSVCNNNSGFYGESGSSLRRRFGKKLDSLRRRKIKGYFQELQNRGVKPSRETLKEAKTDGCLEGELLEFVRAFQDSALTDLLSDIEDEEISEESDDTASGEAGIEEEESSKKSKSDSSKSSTRSSNTSIDSIPTRTMDATSTPNSKSRSSSKKKDKKKSSNSSNTHADTKAMVNTMQRLTLDDGSTLPSTVTYSIGESPTLFYIGDGSKKLPFVTFVNTEKPEAHQGDFYIVLLPNRFESPFLRNVWEIRKTIPNNDVDFWTAKIPTKEDGVPLAMESAFKGRVVLVKGPAIDYWNRDAPRFNANMKTETCEASKKTRNAAATKHAEEPERHFQHTLLVFPPGTLLNVHHLPASNPDFLRRSFVGMRDINSKHCKKINPEDEEDHRRENLYGLVALFHISENGGELESKSVEIVTTDCYY